MSALLAGELRRVTARRLVRWIFALAAIGIVVGALITFFKTSSISQSAYEARVQAAQASATSGVTPPPGLSFCQPGQKQATRGPINCVPRPTVEVHDPRFHLTSLKNVFEAVVAPLCVLASLIGASVMGAEWPNRTITTILTWESRRVRVLAAKSIAIVVVSVVLTLATLVLLGVALLPAALLHGTTMGASSTWWRSLAGVLGRGTALVPLIALIAFSIAAVGRSTASALIVFFGYVVILERFIVLIHGWARWLLVANAVVFITGKAQSIDGNTRTFWTAVVYLLVVTAALYLIAALDFRRRDIA
ncbi:MAG: ABC transporter permease subunit [Acidimicrobiales bacterium]